MTWQIYLTEPLEFNWRYCKSVDETAAEIEKNYPSSETENCDYHCPTLEEFQTNWKMAKQLAQENHWNGDFKQGPVVFWIPSHGSFLYGFAFKQEEDGVTYIISPVELAWLHD